MKTIYLIGFMGSGKSTVGNKLAQSLNKSFVDIDQYIEQTHKRQISQIFAQDGEATFRRYEMSAIKETMTYDIIATGGGVVEKVENIEIMNKGIIIYLETEFKTIFSRLENDETRPLWNKPKNYQKALYMQRCKKYGQIAHKIFQTTNKQVDDIVTAITSTIME